jgi:hypothetical protein
MNTRKYNYNVSASETDPKGELTARASKGDENDATKADQERST